MNPQPASHNTKHEYYQKIHEKLSAELGISTSAIETIRSFALGPDKLTRGQILMWAKKKLETSGKQTIYKDVPSHDTCSDCKHFVKRKFIVASGKPNGKYLEIETFIKTATERNWKDITFPYSYSS